MGETAAALVVVVGAARWIMPRAEERRQEWEGPRPLTRSTTSDSTRRYVYGGCMRGMIDRFLLARVGVLGSS
jgi:hypothetical protein